MALPYPIRRRDENLLFLKMLIKNPRGLGAVAPSSLGLCDLIAKNILYPKDHYILEIGAGTGRITSRLIAAGVDPSHIYVVELDLQMCIFLKEKLPGVNVIHGDARHLKSLLPPHVHSKISTVVSGIPMMNLSKDAQDAIVTSCLNVISSKGILLQFTYGPASPIDVKPYRLIKKRLGHIFFNLPPAFLWMYSHDTVPKLAPLPLDG